MDLNKLITELKIKLENNENIGQFQAECLKLVEKYPTNIELRKLCGDMFLKRKKYFAASEQYLLAKKYGDESLELEYLLFQAYCLNGKFNCASRLSNPKEKLVKNKVLYALVEKITNPQKDIEEIISFSELKLYPLLLEILECVKKKNFKAAIDFIHENKHIFNDTEHQTFIICLKELNLTQNSLYEEEISKLPIYIQEIINNPSENYEDYKIKIGILRNELSKTKLPIITFLLGVLCYNQNDIYPAIDYFKEYLAKEGKLEIETKSYMYLCYYFLGKDLQLSFAKQKFEMYEQYYIRSLNEYKNRLDKIATTTHPAHEYIYSKQYYSEFKLICSLAKHGEYFKILDRVENNILPLQERPRLSRDAYDLFAERNALGYTHTLVKKLSNTKYKVD